MDGESRRLTSDGPFEVKPLRQFFIVCRYFAERSINLCVKGRLHGFKVLPELHLRVCVGFFPNKLIPKKNPYSFSFQILQDTWIFL